MVGTGPGLSGDDHPADRALVVVRAATCRAGGAQGFVLEQAHLGKPDPTADATEVLVKDLVMIGPVKVYH